jgi:hypothetical protein
VAQSSISPAGHREQVPDRQPVPRVGQRAKVFADGIVDTERSRLDELTHGCAHEHLADAGNLELRVDGGGRVPLEIGLAIGAGAHDAA